MVTIKSYAHRFEIFVKLLFFCTSTYTVTKWLIKFIPPITTMPITHRLAGLFVDSVGIIVLIFGLISFVRLMRCFQNGEIFSQSAITHLQRITKIALIWALYTPINGSLLSIIMSLQNPPGQRLITVTFWLHDVINIFIFGLFVIIVSIMKEGSRLQQEQDLTI